MKTITTDHPEGNDRLKALEEVFSELAGKEVSVIMPSSGFDEMLGFIVTGILRKSPNHHSKWQVGKDTNIVFFRREAVQFVSPQSKKHPEEATIGIYPLGYLA